MRFLVTGAQGCIGAWTLKLLLETGHEVVAFDQAAELTRLRLIWEGKGEQRLRVVQGDLCDTARVKKLVAEEQITHVIHLAAVLMPFCQAQPVAGGMINVIGTLNVFEAARDARRPVRIVYASSSAVWGPEEAYGARSLSERDPLLPGTHYGVFKQANEGNARVFYSSNGISSVGLRPWTVYGAGRDSGLTADPTLAIRAAVLGQRFQIRVSGHMDLQYVEDVAAAFVRSATSGLEGAHVFNLAGTVVEMGEFVALLEKHLPRAAGLISAEGPQVPVSYRMDASALHAAIPGLPSTPLDDGIGGTIAIFERLHSLGRLSAVSR